MSDTQKIVHLPDLPVYQDIYCSQELTDRLCRYVCENRPEFVQELIEQEKLPFPDNRDAMLGKACSRIEYYLRDEAKEGRVPELSMLGMIDFIYEIDRRVRRSLGLFDIPVVGTPLAPTPEGPFPELVDNPMRSSTSRRGTVSQTIVNECVLSLYEVNPQLCYQYCEHARRLLRSGGAAHELSNLSSTITGKERADGTDISLELRDRLRMMCNLPNYEQIKALEPKGLSL